MTCVDKCTLHFSNLQTSYFLLKTSILKPQNTVICHRNATNYVKSLNSTCIRELTVPVKHSCTKYNCHERGQLLVQLTVEYGLIN